MRTKKFKITRNMDLIKIYEKGQFEDFKIAYEKCVNENDEFVKLHHYFVTTYYPEFRYPGVDFNKITLNEIYNLPMDELLKIERKCKWENIIFTPKDIIKEDPLYQRFTEIASQRLGAINPRNKKLYLREDFKDEFGRIFAEKYLIRNFKTPRYITLKEDAIKYGCKEIIDFINNHPLPYYDLKEIQNKRLTKKFIDIKENNHLTNDELAEMMKVDPINIKAFEKWVYPVDSRCIDVYAKLGNMSVDELLEFDSFKEAYYKTQDYYTPATCIKINLPTPRLVHTDE